jgi:IS605 OrfB family transposase
MNYLCDMKLTLQIKLLPDKHQSELLLKTIKEANTACNAISEIAFTKRMYNQFRLHKEVYYLIKDSFKLSAQMIIRCISKVTDAYKLDRKTRRDFKPLGAITYDCRIMNYKPNNIVSLWAIGGRLNIPFVCHNAKYLPYIKGEGDLVYRKDKFYLFQTVEVPEEDVTDIEEFIGVDFGQTDIAVTSNGKGYSSDQIKEVRKKYTKVRASVQSKGTKGAKKLLKRLSRKEFRFVSITNHTIAKEIVAQAKEQGKGIAIEDLSHIRKTAKPRSRADKTELNRWSFYQLRQFLTYKALLNGVKLVVIPAAYTSQNCHVCNHIGIRKGKRFSCKNCGSVMDADLNASYNISAWGCVVNQPEKSTMYCSLHTA